MTEIQEIVNDPREISSKAEEDGLLSNELSFESSSSQVSNILFHELYYFATTTQSNVYGLTEMASETATRLLVATLSGKIYRLSFDQKSIWKSVDFSYIPAFGEIISVDMFATENHGPIVGVTLLIKKDSESSREIFFNIYGLHTKPTKSPDWEKIAGYPKMLSRGLLTFNNPQVTFCHFKKYPGTRNGQNRNEKTIDYSGWLSWKFGDPYIFSMLKKKTFKLWSHSPAPSVESLHFLFVFSTTEDWQTLNLSFIPFLLTHTQLPDPQARCDPETVFLLSGDDLKIHLYRQVTGNDKTVFREEMAAEAFFPEFSDLCSSITCIDITLGDNSTRLTAFGCQSGYVRCSQVDLSTKCVLWTCDSRSLDGPITSVRLFNNHTHKEIKDGVETVHLLVTSAVELGCVFIDILQSELGEPPLILPNSNCHDSVLCSEVADITWDGRNEIILGTYGKKLMVYSMFIKDSQGKYYARLDYTRDFAHPIHRILYSDVTGDGLCELVVLSTAGLHVLQHDLSQACQVCLQKLKEKNGLNSLSTRVGEPG